MTPDNDARLATLKNWLDSLADQHRLITETLKPASSDASFRRYFRLQGDGATVIAMDAPPAHEDCRAFVHVTELLRQAGLHVPVILAQDLQAGFLLISDLGRRTYYDAIQAGLENSRLQTIYRDAIATLVRMQHADATTLPIYDQHRLEQELKLFPQWYGQQHCQADIDGNEQTVLRTAFSLLAHDIATQPAVFVHRDFHSPNLMLSDPGEHGRGPGVIDYQDAVLGPLTYDIASLVMDARTTWEEPQQLDWAIRYWEAARAAGIAVHDDFAAFHRAYEWMSLQRNLRILGVFARLSHRDQKHHYLDHIPRVNGYVRQVATRYSVFRPLLRLLDKFDNRQVTVGYTF